MNILDTGILSAYNARCVNGSSRSNRATNFHVGNLKT